MSITHYITLAKHSFLGVSGACGMLNRLSIVSALLPLHLVCLVIVTRAWEQHTAFQHSLLLHTPFFEIQIGKRKEGDGTGRRERKKKGEKERRRRRRKKEKRKMEEEKEGPDIDFLYLVKMYLIMWFECLQ